MVLKILDAFAGIGGFSYAAERLVGGYKTKQFIEIDEYCQSVDSIFEILEGVVDKHYDKIEKAQSKQPDMEW